MEETITVLEVRPPAQEDPASHLQSVGAKSISSQRTQAQERGSKKVEKDVFDAEASREGFIKWSRTLTPL